MRENVSYNWEEGIIIYNKKEGGTKVTLIRKFEKFKKQVAVLFIEEILDSYDDIKKTCKLIREKSEGKFLTIFQEGDSVVKVRMVKESDRPLYFSNVEGFSLTNFSNSFIIIDHVFRNNGFMVGIRDNGDFIISQMSLDGNSLHFYKNKVTIINNGLEDYEYVLFILELVLFNMGLGNK